MKNFYLLIFLFGSLFSFGQTTYDGLAGQISKLDTSILYLNKDNWKYHSGDDKKWAEYNYDDSNWDTYFSCLCGDFPEEQFTGVCWLRLKLKIDSTLINKPLGFKIMHAGASEVYIDGKLVHKFGKVGVTPKEEVTDNPAFPLPVGIVFDEKEEHVIAIRYSNHYFKANKPSDIGVFVEIKKELDNYILFSILSFSGLSAFLMLTVGLLWALGIVHLLLFLFYRKNKSNLYYSLFVLLYSLLFLSTAIGLSPSMVSNYYTSEFLYDYSFDLIWIFMLFGLSTFLYSIFYKKFPKIYWVIVALTFIAFVTTFLPFDNMIILGVQIIFLLIDSIRVIVRSIFKKMNGAMILGLGFLVFIISILAPLLYVGLFQSSISYAFIMSNLFYIYIALLSIPISMSVYLAREFATVNKDLESEKENLEIRVVERTTEISKQKKIIEEAHQDMLDSIVYAKRIQEAILPPPRLVKEWLTESFIFYKPKDIVAGDFYWMETATYTENDKEKTLVYFAAADCTGHGVPGAMVSVVCANALNRAIKEFSLIEPGHVLDKVTELVIESFEKSDEEIKDGMDIALCALDISAKKIYYSGANNPLYRITTIDQKVDVDSKTETNETHQLIEYKATRQPVGQYDNLVNFKTVEIQLEPGDAIYLFSDGFPDQFGGEKGKKYKYSSFRKCLLANFNHPMEEQKKMLAKEFNDWKGDMEQIDDVCVIGVKINGVEKNNFTKRELEVLGYLQEGLPSKLIADKMFISKNTVDTYRRRLLAKTGTYNATELINYCIKKEII